MALLSAAFLMMQIICGILVTGGGAVAIFMGAKIAVDGWWTTWGPEKVQAVQDAGDITGSATGTIKRLPSNGQEAMLGPIAQHSLAAKDLPVGTQFIITFKDNKDFEGNSYTIRNVDGDYSGTITIFWPQP